LIRIRGPHALYFTNLRYSSVPILGYTFCWGPRSTHRLLEPLPEAFMAQCRYIEASVVGSSTPEAIVVKVGSTPKITSHDAARRRHSEATTLRAS